eukprot:SAG31_NODE_15112_length_770_cov_1.198212_1_plen_120_part_01
MLVAALDSGGVGSKALVMDPALPGPLNHIAEKSLLKEHGVEQLFLLEPSLFNNQLADNVVYMMRPNMHLMHIVADHLKEHPDRQYSLFFVPSRSVVCEKILEDEGVLPILEGRIGEAGLD